MAVMAVLVSGDRSGHALMISANSESVLVGLLLSLLSGLLELVTLAVLPLSSVGTFAGLFGVLLPSTLLDVTPLFLADLDSS